MRSSFGSPSTKIIAPGSEGSSFKLMTTVNFDNHKSGSGRARRAAGVFLLVFCEETNRSVIRRKFDRVVLLAGAEFEDFPPHPGRHSRDRIDAKHRLAERADGLASQV